MGDNKSKHWLKIAFLISYIEFVVSSTTCDPDLCSTCAGSISFICSTCNSSPSSTVIIDNICLPNCPYGFSTSPCASNTNAVVDVTFEQNTFSGQYGPFITGSSSSTYQFFSNPDSDDPTPSYHQGLYFNGISNYLSTGSTFYPNYKVAFCMWLKPISPDSTKDLLYLKPGSGTEIMRVNTQGGLRLKLETLSNSQGTLVNSVENLVIIGTFWYFSSYTITFSSTAGSTTMTQYLNNVVDFTVTTSDQLFRWYNAGSQTLIIGKGPTGTFYKGWIYSFKFWNTDYSAWSTAYSAVCGSATNSCFLSCDYGKYWSGSACVACASQCTKGCIDGNRCNCDDPLCSVCTGYGSGLCTTCGSNTSGGGATACSCSSGYYKSGLTCASCSTGCAVCTGGSYYQCSSCISGYYFLNTLCLSSCPGGFTQDSTNNICTQSSNTAISIAFQNQIALDTLSGVTVGSDNTNKYPTFEATDPIPSIYRGYYFSTGLYMTLNSLSISPYFTTTMWIKPTGAGHVVTKSNTVDYFLLTITSSGYPSLQLMLSDGTSTVTLTGSTSQFNAWHNIAYTGTINSSGKTVLNLYIDGSSISSATSANALPFIDAGKLYIGRLSYSNGFTGFLWSLKIYNDNTLYNSEWITSGCPTGTNGCSNCPSEKLCPSTCDFGAFLSGSSCVSCSSGCSAYGCRSTDTCRLCKNSECSACSLFDGACTACISNANLSGGVCSCNSNSLWAASTSTCEVCDNLCSACAGTYSFLCSACIATATLVGNICLNECPYGFTTSPSCTSISTAVIDQTFDTNFSGAYGIFTTSSSASTYQFWNSPDSYDPTPAYKRGLYFYGGQYLASTNIYLSNSVSMGLWIYVITSGDILEKKSRLSFSTTGVVKATLENPTQTTTSSVSSAALSAFSGWVYLSFTITYTSGATKMTAYKNGAAGTTLSTTAYLYRDVASDVLYLGKSSSSTGFSGFIYYFSLWNTAITDFTSKFTIPCGTSLTTSCLWTCTMSQYYGTSSCATCSSCSNLGCRRASSCNICYDPLCAQCSGFGANLCTLCVSHASGGSATPCSCDSSYYTSADGFSCLFLCTTGCASCSGSGYYQCISCSTGYYYLNGLCLSSCPTGYTQDSTNNVCTLTSSTPVNLSLQNLIMLDTTSGFTVGSSSTNAYPSWTDTTDPVPSISRGYYFTTSSTISLSSLKITPFFTITMWIKVTSQGNLFLKLNGSSDILKIVIASSYAPTLTLKLSDSNILTLTGSGSLYNSWHNIAFTGDIVSGNTKIYYYADGALKTSQTSSTAAQFIDSGSLYLGSSNGSFGFVGFLWSLRIFNGNTHYLDEWVTSGCPTDCSSSCPSEKICPDTCAFGTFSSSGSCTSCPGSCSPHGCRATDTCILCKNKECTACTLFDGPCTACITNASLVGGVCTCNSNRFWVSSSASCELCDALCSTCAGTDYFLCSVCSGSAVLAGNACLNACPYGFSTSPSCTVTSASVIDQTFDTDFLGTYGIFTTSTSAATYQFWNTPDSSDPVPAYKRGLYFSSGQYLVSNTNIYLSNSVSMGLWIYVITSGDILQKPSRLLFSATGVITATLETTSQTTLSASTAALSFSGWTYLSFTITYTSGATTMTAYKNGAAGTTVSKTAYLYRDAASDKLYIGKSTSSFVGFIYYFSLWNAAITDFSSKFAIPCSSNLDTSCLWTCTISQYYGTSSCLSCSSCSNLGCRRASSCNICYDPLCAQCSGFGANLCTLCVTHATGGLTTPCACDANYWPSADGFSCIYTCTTGCAGCTGGGYYQCTSCLTSYYYLNGLCLSSCPTGYTQDSTNHVCTLSSSTPVLLTLQNLIMLDTTNSFTVGSSSTNTYPSWTDAADPVPSIYRGYYFTSSSKLSLSSLKITPFFTITIWLKATAQGNLFLKLNGSSEILKIVIASSGWPIITLALQDSTSVSLSGSTTLLDNWHNIAFTGDIASGKTKITFYTDGSFISFQTSTNSSPFIDAGSLYLGNSNGANSFVGFLWSIRVFNGNTYFLDQWKTTSCSGSCSGCPSELICPDNCSFGSFYDSSSCVACSSSCSPYGCRSSLTCRLCLQKECKECTLFDGACTSCIDRATLAGGVCACDSNAFWLQSSQTCEYCDNLCTQCAGIYYFLCTTCATGEILVGNVCLHECPYGFGGSCSSVASQVITESFNQDFEGSYGIFTTATSSASYQFFTSPETNDPIPAMDRGLYFSSGKYLESSIDVYLSYSFSLGFWAYVETAGDLFEKQNRLIINSNGAAQIILESPSSATTTIITGVISSTGWSYYSITLSYSSGSTTSTVYINNIAGISSTTSNYIFRDVASQTILIGKSAASSFSGFIYNFNLWNSQITDFSNQVNDDICGAGHGSDCLWACGFDSYKNAGGSCSLCNSCSKGCVRGVSCNVCDDKLCSVCTGFGANLCTTCVAYASGSPCVCDTGYYPSANGFSCVYCQLHCSSCNGFNYNECSSCLSSYYFIYNLCEPNCPTGYTQNSVTNNCDLSSSLALYLNLIDQLRLDTVSGFNVGVDSTNTYPNWDTYDPIPVIKRGYYFTGASYMVSSSSFMFSPFFSLSTWIKGLNDGYFLTKYDSSVTYLSITFTSGIPKLTIKLLDGNFLSVTGTSSIFSSWNFLSFTGEILTDGTTKIICYINGASINNQISGTSSFFRDSATGSLALGGDLNLANGFKGYVWNLKIYNDNSNAITDWTTSGCGSSCTHCPTDLNCLNECSLSTYPSSCTACKTGCNYGCVSSLTCRLCKAKECLSCNTFTGSCLSCIPNASLSGTTCQCNPSTVYSDSSESCVPCNSACALCSTTTWAGCVSCSGTNYLFENLCIKYCPTGYSKSGNLCIIDSSDAYVYNLRPNQIKDEVIDLQSHIVTGTGIDRNFYPNYRESDPYAAQYRGYYFNGKSYMSIATYSKALILAPKFTISIWLNPTKSSGDLFAKQSNSVSVTSILKLSLAYYNPSLKLKLKDGSIIQYTSASSLSQNKWNLLIVSSGISATPSQIISFSINTAQDWSSDLGTSWFEDLQDSFKITIGSSFLSATSLGNYFNGFLWDLKIRNKIVDFSTLYSNSCSQCSICPVDNLGDCIPNCPISKFWNGAQCSSCNDTCSAIGCTRYDKTCNLCTNVLCSTCNDFIAGSCLQCKANAYLSSGECICNNGYFLNKTQEECLRCDTNQYSVNGICKNCPVKCTSCYDLSICTECIDRAELAKNSSCICKAGYNGINCDPAYFDANLTVNDDNSLNLTFSENLVNTIAQSNIYIIAGDISVSDYNWTVERINDKFYNISLIFSVEVDSKTPVTVKLLNSTYFVSDTNALLKNDTLTGILYHYNPYSSSQAAGAVTSQTTAAVQSIVGTSLAVSFINPNPACLWSMLNTLNYIAYLGLTDIPMSDSLYAFVKSLNGNYYLPNIFELMIDEDQGTAPYSRAKRYGYDTDLLLLNVGSSITTLGAIVATIPIIYFLSRCSHRYLGRKLAGLLKNYKWSVFVRFWIQTYLDITAAAIIGLVNVSF